MSYNFDEIIPRAGTDCGKWSTYDSDVLPLWVADMDFRSPQPVVEALQARVAEGVFGYGRDPVRLREIVCERMQRLYAWRIDPDSIVFLPGLVCGLNVVCRAIGAHEDGVLINTPVYPPFLTAPAHQSRRTDEAELKLRRDRADGHDHLYYEVDFAAFETAITPTTRLFLLCNPHNPVGRAYTPAELTRMAEICLRHDLVVCSDEIHCDLLLGDTQHTPIASIDAEIAARSITLLAPSKSYNLPGLGCSLAIIPNAVLRAKVTRAAAGIVPHVNILGHVAAEAAYSAGDEWLAALRNYLTSNRDFAVDTIAAHMPSIQTTVPEATYLLWLDCRASGIVGNPQTFFLDQARVALNCGSNFGHNGQGFVRLNFGCPRATLEEALGRMREALGNL